MPIVLEQLWDIISWVQPPDIKMGQLINLLQTHNDLLGQEIELQRVHNDQQKEAMNDLLERTISAMCTFSGVLQDGSRDTCKAI